MIDTNECYETLWAEIYDSIVSIVLAKLEKDENFHKILYKCPICGCEGKMDSHKTILECTHCNSKWELNEYGEFESNTNNVPYKLRK